VDDLDQLVGCLSVQRLSVLNRINEMSADGAIVSVVTGRLRSPDFYRARLQPFHGLSHVTIEVHSR
jgi:hypothetical protein